MSKNITLNWMAAGCLLLLIPVTALKAQDSLRFSPLDEVVFTANKYDRKQSETGKVLTVIDRSQLERSSGRTVGELLNNISGTTIIGSNSALGTNLTASIRGSSSGNVLILIDGVPANDPSVLTNYFDLNFLTTNQVERIEILKGGQSTLYGSDAVAGVINIITRKPGKAGLHTDMLLSGGSYGTFKTNIGIRETGERSSMSIQYGYLGSEGFSTAHDSAGGKGFEKDGHRQHNLNGTWKVSLTDRLSASIHGQYSHYKSALDAAAFRDEGDNNVTTDNFNGGLGLSYEFDKGGLQFNYRYNNVRRHYLNDSVFNAPNYLEEEYLGKTHFTELYGSRKWQHAELLAGIDYRRHIMSLESFGMSSFGPFSSTIPGSLADMEQISPYASLIVKAKKTFSMEFGGRWNNHSIYGNNFSYNVNPVAMVGESVKLFTNLYSAFKTPTLYQLFNPFAGNTSLTPEESFNIEGGMQWFITRSLNVRAVYFHRKTKDAIEFIYTDPDNFISQYMNISSKKVNGIELEFEYRDGIWNIAANYTHLSGSLKSGYDNAGFPAGKDTVINNIFRNPNDVFNFSAGRKFGERLYAGLTMRIAGKRLEPVYAGAPLEMDGYYTVDLYGEYGLGKKLKLFADLKNITDQEYFEILGYNTRGFNVMGGLRLGL